MYVQISCFYNSIACIHFIMGRKDCIYDCVQYIRMCEL